MLVIGAGVLLDAPADLSGDQRLIVALVAGILAAILGIAGPDYRRRP